MVAEKEGNPVDTLKSILPVVKLCSLNRWRFSALNPLQTEPVSM
jgi:hypothetical protein